MKKLIITLILMSSVNVFSQFKDKNETIQRITNKSAKFLLERGDIENLENINSKISIIEILEIKVLGFNEDGVYRLYSHKNPSFTYILLKKDTKIKIIDLKNFSKSFGEIIRFLDSSSFEDSRKINYLEKVIEVYKNNNYNEKIKL